MTASVRRIGAVAALAAVLATSACGLRIPEDPDGTLDAVVAAGVLAVGASDEPGLVEVDAGAATGPLADVVERFADGIGVGVTWTEGSEETLVGMLETGDVDIAVGGFTDASPWIDRAGLTRGYPDLPGAVGRPVVLLVPLGENRLLAALEAHLDAEAGG
ncbi:type 2 periplasmic-binding domain-containing protein [Microbacterium gilvum]|uniref:Solute-binding protein family 3/N-terminal domain-containing protein n=1 Tax=Microbacterium gilvum TaxID=1336204 RepID=A0ABP9A849_9MICO